MVYPPWATHTTPTHNNYKLSYWIITNREGVKTSTRGGREEGRERGREGGGEKGERKGGKEGEREGGGGILLAKLRYPT